MSQIPNLSRREFIKATSIMISGLIGMVIGLPSIVFLLSPSLRKMEDDSVIDLGPTGKVSPWFPNPLRLHAHPRQWLGTDCNPLWLVRRPRERDGS